MRKQKKEIAKMKCPFFFVAAIKQQMAQMYWLINAAMQQAVAPYTGIKKKLMPTLIITDAKIIRMNVFNCRAAVSKEP